MVCRQKRADAHSVYTLIAANQAKLSVQAMCKHLQVSASGYYDWSGCAPSKRTAANVTLLAHIEVAHAMSDATYGMPRIRAELLDQGVLASRKRIASVMGHAHIRGVSRRRGYVVTTTQDKRQRPAPDLVKRQFVATDINQLWAGRYDLCADLGPLSLLGSGHSRVQPQSRGLVGRLV